MKHTAPFTPTSARKRLAGLFGNLLTIKTTAFFLERKQCRADSRQLRQGSLGRGNPDLGFWMVLFGFRIAVSAASHQPNTCFRATPFLMLKITTIRSAWMF